MYISPSGKHNVQVIGLIYNFSDLVEEVLDWQATVQIERPSGKHKCR